MKETTPRKTRLPGKKYLFMLVATRASELEFNDLLIYSFLVYRAGRDNTTARKTTIGRNIGLCPRSVRESLKRLAAHGLVAVREDGRWLAKDPGDRWPWFLAVRDIHADRWHDKFVTFPIYILRTGGKDRLTPRQNAVLWKIESWNTSRSPMTVTHQGIATQLRIRRQTVADSIRLLQEKGLLDDRQRLSIKDGNLPYWQDAHQPKRKKAEDAPPFRLKTLVIGALGKDYEPRYCSTLDFVGRLADSYERMMRKAGYTTKDIYDFWRTFIFEYAQIKRYVEWFLMNGFEVVFRVTEEIHAESNGRWKNSLGLLKVKTQGLVRSMRALDARPAQYAGQDRLAFWQPTYEDIKFGSGRKDEDGEQEEEEYSEADW